MSSKQMMKSKKGRKQTALVPLYPAVRLGSNRVSAWPDTQRIILKAALNSSIQSASGALAFTGLVANDLSGTGAPAGLVEFNALYGKWRVLGVKLVFKFVNIGASAPTQSAFVTVVPQLANSSVGGIAQADSISDSKSVVNSIQNNGFKESDVRMVISLAEKFGVPLETFLVNDIYAGTGATAPTSKVYVGIYTQTVDGSSTSTTYFTLSTEYDVLFTNRTPYVS